VDQSDPYIAAFIEDAVNKNPKAVGGNFSSKLYSVIVGAGCTGDDDWAPYITNRTTCECALQMAFHSVSIQAY